MLGTHAVSGGPGGGYVAVGSGQRGPGSVTPTGSVTLVPLDGARSSGRSGGNSPEDAASPGGPGPSDTPEQTTTAPGGSPGTPAPAGGARSGGGGDGGSGDGPGGRTTPPAASPSPAPSGSTTPTPADLSWGAPTTKPADQRWCQKVTVGFRNSGGTAVRSGSVTFGTHVIGALGIDWGTVDSTVDLPVPIAPGAHEDHTWTVCVDAWRVPLGMHIETRDVSVRWK
ncbi:hypothetical protein [Streptomyces puniciscabiei]|uniref:hypothetical protein n=1 Tax=Streptomyces puniciscabiei TaxID=164348 RepID=UPI0033256E21